MQIIPFTNPIQRDPNLDVEVGFYAYNEFVETKKDFIKFEDCEIQQWLKNLESKIRNVGLELRLKFKIENFKYKSIKAGPLAIVTEGTGQMFTVNRKRCH